MLSNLLIVMKFTFLLIIPIFLRVAYIIYQFSLFVKSFISQNESGQKNL